MRSPRVRILPRHLLGVALLTTLAGEACTREDVVGVTIEEIAVLPASVTVLRDESVQLVAEVRDEEGTLLEAATVTWSSDRPAIVTVSPDGLVSAVGVGPATVQASFGGVAGSASILAVSPTPLYAQPESVTLRGAIGPVSPDPVTLHILHDGSKPVDELEASVAYPAESAEGWLDAGLHDDKSPTRLRVTAETTGMPAGAYVGSILVWGRDTRLYPVVIPVRMTVAGMAVKESDGRTLVSGSDVTDDITVELLLRPERDVVLFARSENPDVAIVTPETLRFTPETWNVAQVIRVSAGPGGGGGWFGFESTSVTIAVDRPTSDPAYGPVRDATVTVTAYRSPFRAEGTPGSP